MRRESKANKSDVRTGGAITNERYYMQMEFAAIFARHERAPVLLVRHRLRPFWFFLPCPAAAFAAVLPHATQQSQLWQLSQW